LKEYCVPLLFARFLSARFPLSRGLQIGPLLRDQIVQKRTHGPTWPVGILMAAASHFILDYGVSGMLQINSGKFLKRQASGPHCIRY
jgi:hypothetical protein